MSTAPRLSSTWFDGQSPRAQVCELCIEGSELELTLVGSERRYPGNIPRPTDQRVVFNMFFQDQLPKNPNFKMHLNLVFASGLAQNLAECWQVNTTICISLLQASQQADTLSNEAGVQFERSWLITSISTPSKDPQLLQNLQISVKWPHQDKTDRSVELHWHIRRASTPTWVGL